MLREKFRQWLNQRFQVHGIKQLKQSDILIFIYQQGFVYVVLMLITFIAGINYANNLILGFCFLISAILCISFYLTFKQLHQLQIEFQLPELGRAAETLSISVYLKQPTLNTRYLFLNVDGQLYPILLNQLSQSIELKFRPEQRGAFQIPTVQLYSTYPLGLVRAWSYFYLNKQVWIAPQAQHYQHEYDLVSDSGLPDMDEFRELRNYQIGDSLQTISWKQAARGQGLYVKQFENQTDTQCMTIDYAHMPSTEHEEKLRLMMGLIDNCEQHQTRYTVILNHQILQQGCGTQQYHDAKMILAQA